MRETKWFEDPTWTKEQILDLYAVHYNTCKRILYAILSADQALDRDRSHASSWHGLPTEKKNTILWLEYLLTAPPFPREEWEARVYHAALVWYARLHEDFIKDRLYPPEEEKTLHYVLKAELIQNFSVGTARNLYQQIFRDV